MSVFLEFQLFLMSPEGIEDFVNFKLWRTKYGKMQNFQLSEQDLLLGIEDLTSAYLLLPPEELIQKTVLVEEPEYQMVDNSNIIELNSLEQVSKLRKIPNKVELQSSTEFLLVNLDLVKSKLKSTKTNSNNFVAYDKNKKKRYDSNVTDSSKRLINKKAG